MHMYIASLIVGEAEEERMHTMFVGGAQLNRDETEAMPMVSAFTHVRLRETTGEKVTVGALREDGFPACSVRRFLRYMYAGQERTLLYRHLPTRYVRVHTYSVVRTYVHSLLRRYKRYTHDARHRHATLCFVLRCIMRPLVLGAWLFIC